MIVIKDRMGVLSLKPEHKSASQSASGQPTVTFFKVLNRDMVDATPGENWEIELVGDPRPLQFNGEPKKDDAGNYMYLQECKFRQIIPSEGSEGRHVRFNVETEKFDIITKSGKTTLMYQTVDPTRVDKTYEITHPFNDVNKSYGNKIGPQIKVEEVSTYYYFEGEVVDDKKATFKIPTVAKVYETRKEVHKISPDIAAWLDKQLKKGLKNYKLDQLN